jgi:SET domain-containing protein
VTAPKVLISEPRIDPHYTCFKLTIRRSKIHRYGVYAAERIPANRKVIEYTGKRLNRREAKYTDHTYLFTLDNYWSVDGAVGGSGAEIINHCCEPNLVSRIVRKHILYVSLRAIEPGEELTVDYNLTKGTEVVHCSCGAAACRGTIQTK